MTMPISTTMALAPQLAASRALGFEETETAADEKNSRPQRDRGRHQNEHSDRHGCTHRGEVRQPRKAQTVRRPGNRQARTHDHRTNRPKGGVVRGFAILAGPTRLSITAEDEDPIIRRGCDRQHGQDIRYERGQPKNVVVAQNRDKSPEACNPIPVKKSWTRVVTMER